MSGKRSLSETIARLDAMCDRPFLHPAEYAYESPANTAITGSLLAAGPDLLGVLVALRHIEPAGHVLHGTRPPAWRQGYAMALHTVLCTLMNACPDDVTADDMAQALRGFWIGD